MELAERKEKRPGKCRRGPTAFAAIAGPSGVARPRRRRGSGPTTPAGSNGPIYIVSFRAVQPRCRHVLNCDSKCWGRALPPRRAPVRVQIAAVPVGPIEPNLNRPALVLLADRGPFQPQQGVGPCIGLQGGSSPELGALAGNVAAGGSLSRRRRDRNAVVFAFDWSRRSMDSGTRRDVPSSNFGQVDGTALWRAPFERQIGGLSNSIGIHSLVVDLPCAASLICCWSLPP
jgi:hypothetical protein